MKKILFTLVMIAALAMVAGTANAQVTSPYPSSTYGYTVGDMKFETAGGTFAITSTFTAAEASFSDVTFNGAGAYTLGTDVSVTDGTQFDLTFNVAYTADAAGVTGTITVSATNNANNCTNQIFLTVNVRSLPVFEINITADITDACQSLNSSAGSNVAQSFGQTNTIVFTVNPTLTNVGTSTSDDGTYTYTIDLSNTTPVLSGYNVAYTSGGHTCTPSGSAAFTVTGTIEDGADPANDVFTITFATTTGIDPVTIPGAITAASMTLTSGGGNYADSDGATQASIVRAMPAIGAFE